MSREHPVLLRMATERDVVLTRDFLSHSSILTQTCDNIAQVIEALEQGAGILLIAEETLTDTSVEWLSTFLSAQPPWSDVIVLVLARQGADSPLVRRSMNELHNVTVVERPVRMPALLSALRSAQRARERQLEVCRLLESLRVADERKTEFLATLAHELRNPLAPIKTALDLLLRQPLDAARSTRLHNMMGRQVDHMVRLIDDLMEVSRITRGTVELQRSTVELQSVVNDAIDFSRPMLDSAGHSLEIALPPEPMLVHVDSVRLIQVLVNLLNNAARYTPSGGHVRLVAYRDRGDVVIEITDNGVGLDPEMTERVFEMFVQAGGVTKAARGGLGIGLTLVRALVELHGGTVAAASAGANAGSTFVVRLPGQVATAAAGEAGPRQVGDAVAPVELPGAVLVVDDNRDAANSLAELLSLGGGRVEVAYSGGEALRAVFVNHFATAVLDIGLPDMDGFQLAQSIRQSPTGGAMKLIALSGWGQPSDRQRASAAGFDHHLLKPVDLGQLLALLTAEKAAPPALSIGGERHGL